MDYYISLMFVSTTIYWLTEKYLIQRFQSYGHPVLCHAYSYGCRCMVKYYMNKYRVTGHLLKIWAEAQRYNNTTKETFFTTFMQ